MKRIHVLLTIALLGMLASSCFKDKGNYDYTEINRFEVKIKPEITSTDQTYWVIKSTSGRDSVVFTASVEQTLALDSTNMDLRWYIWEDDETVADTAYGFRHAFYFEEGEDKTYEVNFRAFDKNTGLSYADDFSLRTREAFQYAWVVVHGNEGNRYLGFLDYPSSNNYLDSASVVKDGYAVIANTRRFENLEHVAYMAGQASGGQDRLLLLARDSAWALNPYTMEVTRSQSELYYGGIPVSYSLLRGESGEYSAPRSVLISEGGQFYFADRWGYMYEVQRDASVPENYTATDAFAVPNSSNATGEGYNLIWDGENHKFYFHTMPTYDKGAGSSINVKYTDAELANIRLKDVAAAGEYPTAVNLDDLTLLWMGKGMKDLVSRTTTATALMRSSEGELRFIHFALGGDDGYDEIYMETEPATELGDYAVDENSKFGTTYAFPNQLYFTVGSKIYCLYNGGDTKQIEQIEDVGAGNEIVELSFRLSNQAYGNHMVPSAAGNFNRIFAVAYNGANGGGIMEIRLSQSGALDKTTNYTGFEEISEIEYMARKIPIGY